jgi:hypothetical protein
LFKAAFYQARSETEGTPSPRFSYHSPSVFLSRHSRESGNPSARFDASSTWMTSFAVENPAFAGTTSKKPSHSPDIHLGEILGVSRHVSSQRQASVVRLDRGEQ